jgi:hypothetical protein
MIGELERLSTMVEIRGDGQVGNDEQEEDEKGAGADGPGEANLGDQMHCHERENHTPKRRTCNSQASRNGSLLFEVGHGLSKCQLDTLNL